MAKFQIDAMLDASLAYIQTNTTQMCLCSAIPTTYAEAITTYNLATKGSLTSGLSFTGPADDTSGRKITINAASGVTVASGGTATHVALCSAAALLYATTAATGVAAQTVTAGNTVTFPAWKINVLDVT
jgi:hypothetical protein